MRKQSRREVQLGALAFRDDGTRSVVALSNISYDGCQFAAASPQFEPAERIWLMLPGRGEVSAEVCWASSGRYGARFDDRSDGEMRMADGSELNYPCRFHFGSGRVFGRKDVSSLGD